MPLLTLSEIIDHFAAALFEVTIPALVAWALYMMRQWLKVWLIRMIGAGGARLP